LVFWAGFYDAAHRHRGWSAEIFCLWS